MRQTNEAKIRLFLKRVGQTLVDNWVKVDFKAEAILWATLGYCKPTFASQLLDRDLAGIDLY